jgi:hypothetical protein
MMAVAEGPACERRNVNALSGLAHSAADSPDSREHAWPDWLLKSVGHDAPGRIEAQLGAGGQGGWRHVSRQ